MPELSQLYILHSKELEFVLVALDLLHDGVREALVSEVAFEISLDSEADYFEVPLGQEHVHNVVALIVEFCHRFVHVSWQHWSIFFVELQNLTKEHCSEEQEQTLLHKGDRHVEEQHQVSVNEVALGCSCHRLIKSWHGKVSSDRFVGLNSQFDKVAIDSVVLTLWIVDALVHHGVLLCESEDKHACQEHKAEDVLDNQQADLVGVVEAFEYSQEVDHFVEALEKKER